MKTKFRNLLATAIVFVNAFASADVVVMQDGEVFEGNVLSFDGEFLKLSSANGESSLHKNRVEAIFFGISSEEFEQKKQPKTISRPPVDTSQPPPATADGNYVKVELVSAKIEKPRVKDMWGDIGVGENHQLVFRLRIVNTHDRKIVRFNDNQFMSKVGLTDDVDNSFRSVNYGFSSLPVGAMKDGADIKPGETVGHLEIFEIPPPATESLTMRIDLSLFGDSGQVEIDIPVSEIVNWPHEIDE